MSYNLPKNTPFKDIIAALLDDENILSPTVLYRLSDLSLEEANQLKEVWPRITLTRRQALMVDLEKFIDDDLLLDFDAVGMIAIKDPDPAVRHYAVLTMWNTETSDHARLLIRLAEHDDHLDVRAAAVAALGAFVYQGEVEEIEKGLFKEIMSCLLGILDDNEDPLLQRKALESIGYATSKEVDKAITDAYTSDDDDWMTSALVAMGRSGNSRWKSQVLESIENNHFLVREEAVRAAGELYLEEAQKPVIACLEDPDDNVRLAAIWAISSIGGKGVEDILEIMLEECEDDEEAVLIENALENLAFSGELDNFSIFDLTEEDIARLQSDLKEEDE